jgi:hypothetical protein
MAMQQILVSLWILASAALFWSEPARAHDWYPKECCNARDCAPVEATAWSIPLAGGLAQLVVTSKHGTATVPHDFPAQESKDSRMHVCIRQNEFGSWDVMCLFMPPRI